MYHFKNSATHQNKDISDKVNFFADCFEFIAMDLGKIDSPELENHRSLVKKSIYHLNNWTVHSKKYLLLHLAHNFFSKRDLLAKEHYSDEISEINYKKSRCNYSIQSERDTLKQSLLTLLQKLEESLFKNALDLVISAIQCKHPLNKHNHVEIIEYCTHIIISEFVFAGFDVLKLNELFNRIFENEVKFSDNEVSTKAPLPLELVEMKNDPTKFYKVAKQYLEKRNLKQQIEGIYILFKQSIRPRTIIFSIHNIEAYEPISMEYDGVRFSNELGKIYLEQASNDEFSSFFDKQKILAEVEVFKGDEVSSIDEAINRIENALNYFNSVFKAKGRLDVNQYIISENNKGILHTIFPTIVKKEGLSKFLNGNVELHLKGINTNLAKRIEKSDSIYFKALTSIRIEDRIVHSWRYLESFFEEDNYDAKQIQKNVSKLLSKDSLVSLAFVNYNLACQILRRNPLSIDRASYFGISKEKWLDLLPKEGMKITNVDFEELHKVINHPYLSKKLKWQINSSIEEVSKLGYNYYFRTLRETYEQRNIIEHNGDFNELSSKKLKTSLPNLTRKFRVFVTQSAKSGVYKTFSEIIESLDGVSK